MGWADVFILLGGPPTDRHMCFVELSDARIRQAFDLVWARVLPFQRETILARLGNLSDSPHRETFGATKSAWGYVETGGGQLARIWMSPDLAREPLSFICAAVAHELAHLLELKPISAQYSEKRANDMARLWGFWDDRLLVAEQVTR